jgi:hypothetical protein
VFAQAINWFTDPSDVLGSFTKIPMKSSKYESLKVKKSKIDTEVKNS